MIYYYLPVLMTLLGDENYNFNNTNFKYNKIQI